MKTLTVFSMLLFATLVVCILIVVLLRQRKAIQKLRSSIACDLHDELGASLSNISMLAGLIALELPRETAAGTRAYLARICEEADQIHSSISDTVAVLGSSCRQLGHLAALINRHGHELLEQKGIHFSLSVAQSLKALHIPPSQRRHLYLIIKEALHNAMRHSEASEVSVRFDADCRRLYCSIEDNGKGFDNHKMYSGAGIGSMNMRMNSMKGKLKIKSSAGNGCSVHLSIPIYPWWHPTWWRLNRPQATERPQVPVVKVRQQGLSVEI